MRGRPGRTASSETDEPGQVGKRILDAGGVRSGEVGDVKGEAVERMLLEEMDFGICCEIVVGWVVGDVIVNVLLDCLVWLYSGAVSVDELSSKFSR